MMQCHKIYSIIIFIKRNVKNTIYIVNRNGSLVKMIHFDDYFVPTENKCIILFDDMSMLTIGHRIKSS